jgi:hypothetical protein
MDSWAEMSGSWHCLTASDNAYALHGPSPPKYNAKKYGNAELNFGGDVEIFQYNLQFYVPPLCWPDDIFCQNFYRSNGDTVADNKNNSESLRFIL